MANQHNETIQQQTKHPMAKPEDGASCCHFPEFTRLKYFYGQMLGQHDFQTEQDYFREKLRLHNRCLHGYGTVCGLEVNPVEMKQYCEDPSHDEQLKLETEMAAIEQEIKKLIEEQRSGGKKDQKEYEEQLKALRAKVEEIRRRIDELQHSHKCEDEKPTLIQIDCGLALDCHGNELIVRQPLTVDVWQTLSPEDRKRIDDKQTLYVSICYCAIPVDPVRPVLMDTCGGTPECVYGKLRDALRVSITIDPPKADGRCENCCDACGDECLLLATITGFKRHYPLETKHIDNSVRRMIGTYQATTITGISWTHGATYTIDEAKEILGTREKQGGLEIRFSRPVLAETLADGVVDLWVIEGGPGKSGNITHLGSDFVDESITKPTTDSFKYRQTTRESLQEGDRVLITVRASFILDECCRAVDGDHIGGRVPIIAGYEKNKRDLALHACVNPPRRTVPWTSGNGTGGGTFESWFYINTTETGHDDDDDK